jgi:hypothetical protein
VTAIEDSALRSATSCEEAGVDFSLRSAFCDLSAPAYAPRADKCPAQAGSWGLVNLLQIAYLCGAARRQAGRASPGGRIPRGFRRKAQGCETRATLGCRANKIVNPDGVVASVATGCRNPVGVGCSSNRFPWVARASQPRARRRNPFGIGRVSTADTQTVLVFANRKS